MMRYLSVLFLFMMSHMAYSQVANPGRHEAAIASAVEKMRLAMLSGSRANLEMVLNDDLTYGHSSGKIQDKASFVEDIVTRKSDFKSIMLQDQSITVHGKMAVVRHIMVANTNDDNIPKRIRLGIVLVFIKHHQQWKVSARHAFRVPD